MKVRSCTFLIKSQRSCAYHQCNSNQTCGHFERGVVASRNFLVFSFSLQKIHFLFNFRLQNLFSEILNGQAFV